MKLVRQIMIIMVLSFIIPFIAMSINLATYEYNNSVDTYMSYMSSMLLNINSETSAYVTDINAHASDIAGSNAFRQLFKDTANPILLSEAVNNLDYAVNYSQYTRNAVIINLDGEVIISQKALPRNYSPNMNLLARARNQKSVMIDTKFFQHDSQILFTVYAPIISSGQVQGFYVQFMSADSLEMLAATHKIYINDEFFMIDGNNMLISDNKFIKITDGIDISKNEFINNFKTIEAWGVDEIHTFKYYDSNGRTKKIAMFIRDSVTNICYVYACPVSKFSEGSSAIMWIILIYALLIGAIVTVAYVLLQKRLNKGFAEIFKTIEIYEMGDWTYRPSVITDDELGTISKSLWNLAQNLNKMYVDIKFKEYRYKLAMEFSGDLMFDYNLKTNIFVTDKNKWESFLPIPHLKNEKRISEELIKIMHPDDVDRFIKYRKMLENECDNGQERQFSTEFRIKLKDEKYHWFEKKDVLVKGMSENIEHIIGTFVIIDERKNSELALTQKATMDSLTGLYNRFTFINKADEELKGGSLDSAAVVFIDLDDFKFINDTYGHDVGDDVLRFVSTVIKSTTTGNGFGGRYGGDEFLIFLEDEKIAEQTASEILKGLSKEFKVRGSGDILKIKCSIGISKYPYHDTEIDGLIKKADNAMYYIKKNGKNRYNIYDGNKGAKSSENKE